MSEERMTVTVWGDGGELCIFSIPKKELKPGDTLEVDFDDPETEWHDGLWGKEEGQFSFTIHSFENGDLSRPCVYITEEDTGDDAPMFPDDP